jgi:hypothetical protein
MNSNLTVTATFVPKNPSPSPPAQVVNLSIEAESASRFVSPMEAAADSGASGGKIIWVKEGSASISHPSQNGGYAEIPFQVPSAGQYTIWARVSAKDWTSDSFYLKVDGGDFYLWDIPVEGKWVWSQVADRVTGAIGFSLKAGNHTLVLKQREAGARIDKIIVTNDLGFRP